MKDVFHQRTLGALKRWSGEAFELGKYDFSLMRGTIVIIPLVFFLLKTLQERFGIRNLQDISFEVTSGNSSQYVIESNIAILNKYIESVERELSSPEASR